MANLTIQPTQVAGFNQFFDDFNGTRAWVFGGGLDAYLADGLYSGAELSIRELEEPTSVSTHFTVDRDESLYRGYLYWAPHKEWALRGGVEFDLIDSKERDPRRVKLLVCPWALNIFTQPDSSLESARHTFSKM